MIAFVVDVGGHGTYIQLKFRKQGNLWSTMHANGETKQMESSGN
jgi:hypothetical protein